MWSAIFKDLSLLVSIPKEKAIARSLASSIDYIRWCCMSLSEKAAKQSTINLKLWLWLQLCKALQIKWQVKKRKNKSRIRRFFLKGIDLNDVKSNWSSHLIECIICILK